MQPAVTAVIPSLGASPWLPETLEALHREGGRELEVVVVWQGAEEPPPVVRPLTHQLLCVKRNLGFAGATDLGIAAGRGDLVATVNDDLIVEPGWLAHLSAALEGEPHAAAAQGVNLDLAKPHIADGCGLAWNGRWQAVQIGHGEPAPPAVGAPREVFGVSATAALYRRQALIAAALPDGDLFDRRLGSYYEDVDLAGRLRAAGFTALTVPAARARHAGSVTGTRLAWRRYRWLYGNRYLVLARLLGRAFGIRLPKILRPDLGDLARALVGGDTALAAGITAGWIRALVQLPCYAHSGRPLVAPADLLG